MLIIVCMRKRFNNKHVIIHLLVLFLGHLDLGTSSFKGHLEFNCHTLLTWLLIRLDTNKKKKEKFDEKIVII